LVANAYLETCHQSKQGYEEGVAYVLKSLGALPNVVQYVDASRLGGGLSNGWTDDIEPVAQELAKVYKVAGSPKNVRGFATNVAGRNAWVPSQVENCSDGQWRRGEKSYVNLLSQSLKAAGFPGQAIVDTGTNANQVCNVPGNWCNPIPASFGVRPTSNTGDNFTDAFVWAKPGGESDGTSDTSAALYDPACGEPDGQSTQLRESIMY
jgi:cellulose 1,4-beta-cellobiosidase